RPGGTRQTPCIQQVRIKVRDTGNTRRISSQIRPIEVLPKSAAGDKRQKNRERNGDSFHRLAHWRFLAFEIQPVTLNAIASATGRYCRKRGQLSLNGHGIVSRLSFLQVSSESEVFILGAPTKGLLRSILLQRKYWSAWHLNLRVRLSLTFTISSTGATGA